MRRPTHMVRPRPSYAVAVLAPRSLTDTTRPSVKLASMMQPGIAAVSPSGSRSRRETVTTLVAGCVDLKVRRRADSPVGNLRAGMRAPCGEAMSFVQRVALVQGPGAVG